MNPLPRYRIIFHSQVLRHLQCIERKFHSEIRREIDEQLTFEPNVHTRNRKPLNEAVEESEWELRCGFNNQFRIFYRVYPDDLAVNIIAIGKKIRNKLFIGGTEYLV